VKTAIAMHWTGAEPEAARQRLHDAGGRLGELLGGAANAT
jgi:N-acetylmuramic acid 6-phosphate (MurNAc-6-P) etherase